MSPAHAHTRARPHVRMHAGERRAVLMSLLAGVACAAVSLGATLKCWACWLLLVLWSEVFVFELWNPHPQSHGGLAWHTRRGDGPFRDSDRVLRECSFQSSILFSSHICNHIWWAWNPWMCGILAHMDVSAETEASSSWSAISAYKFGMRAHGDTSMI